MSTALRDAPLIMHVRNVVAHALVDNAVLRLARLHEGGGGAAQADGIEGVDVVIVAVWHALLGVDVLAQGGAEVAGLQIVGGQGVARQKPVHKALPHQGSKGGNAHDQRQGHPHAGQRVGADIGNVADVHPVHHIVEQVDELGQNGRQGQLEEKAADFVLAQIGALRML